MNLITLFRLPNLLCAALVAFPVALVAQTPSIEAKEETLVLSTFTVSTTQDQDRKSVV